MNRKGRKIALGLIAIVLGAGVLLKVIPPETDVGIDDIGMFAIDGSLVTNPLDLSEVVPPAAKPAAPFTFIEPTVTPNPASSLPPRLTAREGNLPSGNLPAFGPGNSDLSEGGTGQAVDPESSAGGESFLPPTAGPGTGGTSGHLPPVVGGSGSGGGGAGGGGGGSSGPGGGGSNPDAPAGPETPAETPTLPPSTPPAPPSGELPSPGPGPATPPSESDYPTADELPPVIDLPLPPTFPGESGSIPSLPPSGGDLGGTLPDWPTAPSEGTSKPQQLPTHQVPETGTTAILLIASLAALLLGRRSIVR